MTSLAEGGARSGARRRILWLSLAVSLALNAFFIGMLIWWLTTERMLTPEQRFEQVARELNLSADQRNSFGQFADEVRQGTRQLRDANGPLLKRVWEEMGKAQPDQALVGQLVDQATEHRREYQKQMTAALSRFLSGLSPEQRARFVDLAQRHKDPVAWRLRRLITP